MTRIHQSLLAGRVAALLLGGALLGAACGKATTRPDAEPSTAGVGPIAGTGATSAGGNEAAGGAETSADAGGAAGDRTSLAGAAGSAADDLPDPVTETGACLLYVRRYCEKLAECEGRESAKCFWDERDCPDLLFSEGSTRSVASVVACAKDWRTFPCESLASGQLPECIEPGTKAVGEPCLFSAQCSSSSCVVPEASACGECAAIAEPDQDCRLALSCPNLQRCDPASGKCQSAVVLPAGPGDTCSESAACNALEDLYCRGADATCRPRPGAGEPCAVDAEGLRNCNRDARCAVNQASEMCVALPRDGEPCAIGGVLCASGHFCERPMVTDIGTCWKLRGPGQPCTLTEHCQADLQCDNVMCQRLGLPEQSCADNATFCHRASSCDGTICQPREQSDSFESRCLH